MPGSDNKSSCVQNKVCSNQGEDSHLLSSGSGVPKALKTNGLGGKGHHVLPPRPAPECLMHKSANAVMFRKVGLYQWGKYSDTVLFVCRNYSRYLLQDTLQHKNLGGFKYPNVMIGAVLPWKPLVSWYS